MDNEWKRKELGDLERGTLRGAKRAAQAAITIRKEKENGIG